MKRRRCATNSPVPGGGEFSAFIGRCSNRKNHACPWGVRTWPKELSKAQTQGASENPEGSKLLAYSGGASRRVVRYSHNVLKCQVRAWLLRPTAVMLLAEQDGRDAHGMRAETITLRISLTLTPTDDS